MELVSNEKQIKSSNFPQLPDMDLKNGVIIQNIPPREIAWRVDMDVASNSTCDTVAIACNQPKIMLEPILLFTDKIKASEITNDSLVVVAMSKKLKQDCKVNQDNVLQLEICTHFPFNIKQDFKCTLLHTETEMEDGTKLAGMAVVIIIEKVDISYTSNKNLFSFANFFKKK